MHHLIFCCASLLVFLAGISEGSKIDDNEIKLKKQPSCEDKEKYLALIDIAESFSHKTKHLWSKENDLSECAKRVKAITFLDFLKKLVREIKENFPSCKTFDCEKKLRDCSEVLANGEKKSGVYTIHPSSRFAEKKSLRVFCDMDTNGGGWTVIQRRGNFTPQEDFYKYWADFKVGFGDVKRDFWLGNENIFALTNQGPVELRIDLEDATGHRSYAVYRNFRLEDEENKYKLEISGYTGNASDGMSPHSGKTFSTKDDGNTGAATALKGAWWMTDWAYSHLNGLYLPGSDDPRAIHWYLWRENEGLAFTEMKVRLR